MFKNSVIFSYERCQETGQLGFIPEEFGNDYLFAATDGTLVAHDVIEHNGLNTLSGIGNELEALGAMWWIRGSLNDLRLDGIGSRYTPVENMAVDISEMATKIALCGRGFDLTIPRTYSCCYDVDFLDIINLGRETYQREVEHYNQNEVDRDAVEHYFKYCISFMRSGYRKAKARYPKLNQTRVNALFWSVAETIDNIIKYMDYEGQQIILKYCKTQCNAVAEETHYLL